MAEYIERSVAIAKLTALEVTEPNATMADAKRVLADIPAADVAPVVYARLGTGRFNLETGNYEEQCTRCRNFSKEYGKPYCPNCVAKMDIKDGGDNDAVD